MSHDHNWVNVLEIHFGIQVLRVTSMFLEGIMLTKQGLLYLGSFKKFNLAPDYIVWYYSHILPFYVDFDSFSLKKIFFNVYLFLRQRERQSMNGGGSERGRHRIRNRHQALSCQHRAGRGARTHGPRDHDRSQSQTLNWLSHPGAPQSTILILHVQHLIRNN